MNRKRRIPRWIIIVTIILIAVVVFFLLTRQGNSTSQYTEEATRTGSLETYYSFSGNVAVREDQAINAKTNATIREIYVSEDDTVRKGTALLRLSNGDIVSSDIDGEITDVHVSLGDTVSIGTALVDIVNFDDLQIVLKVDEFDVGAVTVGKEATVTIDALDMTYEAVVEYISKQPQSQTMGTSGGSSSLSSVSSSDVTYYEAKLSAPSDDRILPGMKVDVRILNERVDGAVLLPMSALQFDAYNKPYVFTRGSGNNSVVQTQVSVGIQDGTTVQILDGLRSGDVVLVPQRSSLFPMWGQ